jgi:hypothetical protein
MFLMTSVFVPSLENDMAAVFAYFKNGLLKLQNKDIHQMHEVHTNFHKNW